MKNNGSLKTKDYKFSQLIAYLGNKKRLLPLINKSMKGIKFSEGDIFVDLFSEQGLFLGLQRKKNLKLFQMIENFILKL